MLEEVSFLCSRLNWSGMLLGSLFAYGLGAIWYSKALFANQWMQAQPHRAKEDYTNPGLAMSFQAFATLLQGAFMGVIALYPQSTLVFIFFGLVSAASMYANHLFGGQKPMLSLIDIGYQLAKILVIAVCLNFL